LGTLTKRARTCPHKAIVNSRNERGEILKLRFPIPLIPEQGSFTLYPKTLARITFHLKMASQYLRNTEEKHRQRALPTLPNGITAWRNFLPNKKTWGSDFEDERTV